MRHKIDGRKFNMDSSQRKALYKNMANSLILNGRVKTTLERAKELRRLAERLATLAKDGTLHAKRRALRWVTTKEAFVKLFGDYAEQFKSRNGGYTRIIRSDNRNGDNAKMAYIEYISDAASEEKTTKKRKRRRTKKAAGEQTADSTKE